VHLKFRNINDAFSGVVRGFYSKEYPTRESDSRAGRVIQVTEPVIIEYSHPRERVLLNAKRDANPMFHLYHSLWLLAGRDDVAAPARYVKRYASFSDDGVTSNGSYGRRWRTALASHTEDRFVDQLNILVRHLHDKPESRRAVLQMWDVENDLAKVDSSKDVCCNLSVLLAVNDEGLLDATVFNRSNDLIWGTLGEDYCTFSFLQEYVAAQLGIGVGRYWQVSNNLHVYLNNFDPERWLAWEDTGPANQPYPATVPLVRESRTFDQELLRLVEIYSHARLPPERFDEPFLQDVAQPTLLAHRAWRDGLSDLAAEFAAQIMADDWRAAATAWLERRQR